MKINDMTRGEKLFFFLAVAGIAVVVFAGDQLAAKNLLLPVVGLVFILVFGFFAYQISKSWKQLDEEILDIESPDQNSPIPAAPKKQLTYQDRKKFFFSCLSFIAFILFQEDRFSPPSLIFCGIVLAAGCAWFLLAWIQKRRGKEGQPLFTKAKLQPEQMFYMLFSLAGTCFIIFWIYLVLSKVPQMWWFSIPGFIIGAGVSRPLVAGLRILFRRDKDPGEKHIRRRQDTDPWDRPDRRL